MLGTETNTGWPGSMCAAVSRAWLYLAKVYLSKRGHATILSARRAVARQAVQAAGLSSSRPQHHVVGLAARQWADSGNHRVDFAKLTTSEVLESRPRDQTAFLSAGFVFRPKQTTGTMRLSYKGKYPCLITTINTRFSLALLLDPIQRRQYRQYAPDYKHKAFLTRMSI